MIEKAKKSAPEKEKKWGWQLSSWQMYGFGVVNVQILLGQNKIQFFFCILPFKILHSLLFMILHSYGKNAAVAGRVEFHAFNVDYSSVSIQISHIGHSPLARG